MKGQGKAVTGQWEGQRTVTKGVSRSRNGSERSRKRQQKGSDPAQQRNLAPPRPRPPVPTGAAPPTWPVPGGGRVTKEMINTVYPTYMPSLWLRVVICRVPVFPPVLSKIKQQPVNGDEGLGMNSVGRLRVEKEWCEGVDMRDRERGG